MSNLLLPNAGAMLGKQGRHHRMMLIRYPRIQVQKSPASDMSRKLLGIGLY